MNPRYRSYRRENGTFYAIDSLTGKRESLRTSNPREADRLIQAKNDSHERPAFNLQLARMYLTASDPDAAARNWMSVFRSIIETKSGPTRERWENAVKQRALSPLLGLRLIDTRADHFLSVLKNGTVATNIFLRRVHNFASDMGWLTAPILNRRQWPKPRFKPKRSVTREEHERILRAEGNPEWNAYYQFCWHLGASQSDVAALRAEDIDWKTETIAYSRRKTSVPIVIRLSEELVELARHKLPQSGFLFPRLSELHEKHRAKLFNRRCRLLGIKGISLHAYRYAWAERAMSCGYPERFAQMALGHNSSAVHRAYARNARFTVPSLEEFERSEASRQISEIR